MTDRNLLRAQLLIEAADILDGDDNFSHSEGLRIVDDPVFGKLEIYGGTIVHKSVELSIFGKQCTCDVEIGGPYPVTKLQQNTYATFMENKDEYIKYIENDLRSKDLDNKNICVNLISLDRDGSINISIKPENANYVLSYSDLPPHFNGLFK